MSKLKLAVGSNLTIAKFSHKTSNLPIGLASYHQVLQGDDEEADHLHATYMQTSEEGAGEPLPVVL